MPEPLLDIRSLSVSFATRDGSVSPVREVSASLQRGEILGVVGESGSGKSMLGNAIMRLLPAAAKTTGEVMFDGRDLLALPERDMRGLRGNDIAMIFQDSLSSLNPVLRVGEQMVEAIQVHRKLPTSDCMSLARDTLGKMGIPSPEERLQAYPFEFSGGMRQRVSIAIALLNEPKLIIADEPTTALDITIQSQILSELQDLLARSGTSLIWISHDLSVVANLADRVSVMYAGRFVETGDVRSILRQPRHHYTSGLIQSLPSKNAPKTKLQQIPGNTPQLINLPLGCAFSTRCPAANSVCEALPTLTAASPDHVYACHHPVQEESLERHNA